MPGKNHPRKLFIFLSLCLIFALVSACSGDAFQTATQTPAPTSQPIYQAEVIFKVTVPANSPAGQFVYIDILDEVTGLGLNPLRYSMKPDDPTHYSVHLPAVLGTVIKYRYGRDSTPPAVEYTAAGRQVRYRMAYITGPKTIQDTITAWNDLAYKGATGRINGQVVDRATNAPAPNVLVTAGGLQTLTASNGTFLLDGIQPGTTNLVVYSLDGAYEPFQQEARVAEDGTTPVPISLTPAKTVKVTFVAHPPAGSPRGIPVRMAGNTLAFGNTFADLGGGVSVVASRAPMMTMQQDGSYQLTVNLPTGLDFRYKYTLGDGFWNAELNADGEFLTRQLIIPDQDTTISDQVVSWQSKDFGAVTFNVKAAALPTGETISIQFNPYGWTEPIPMWSLGSGQWLFILYSPLNLLDQVSYRFCRNDQCGVADEAIDSSGLAKQIFTPQATAQTINHTISQWVGVAPAKQTTVVAPDIQPRGAGFAAGIELMPQYRPSWLPYFPAAFQNIRSTGANQVILTPTWTFTSLNPPVLEPVAGKDIIWQDMISLAQSAKQNSLDLVIFPMADFGPNSKSWWLSAARDDGWWQSWFDRYREFILNYADLAQQVKAATLILGDPGVAPALPGGSIDGTAISSPTSENRWLQLLQDVRSRYQGRILWALSLPGNLTSPPDFLSQADGIYALISAPVGSQPDAGAEGFLPQVESILDGDVHALKTSLNKPVVVGIDYPSETGAEKGCITTPDACVAFSHLDPPYVDDVPTQINLQEQVDIYHAFLTAVNDRSWVDGFASRRYYPAVGLQDKSSSVHGKPAADILWYWFTKFLPAK